MVQCSVNILLSVLCAIVQSVLLRFACRRCTKISFSPKVEVERKLESASSDCHWSWCTWPKRC